mmetsp:Transcript_17863/g.26428  ORF Transcript_17863/g.26428 Transcript_17863/m.26428 type:complete len:273 (-) Transcript_17863:33-851(-)|eukprot:CAMPEP_0194222992 /NCGR_PEP_ID=MMETSP0156-20130528/34091_1 /TAXON_ID=33649 /ORGANISM="Thalassionema nitzschioides, Strain L26-B" /LENGTH=272 /DNA_ID=CAMNT_0038953977 /DNA_START=77 /DNA_END=895 /DNA_ORIENTATION=+
MSSVNRFALMTMILLQLLSAMHCSTCSEEQQQQTETCATSDGDSIETHNNDGNANNADDDDFEDDWYGIQTWWEELGCPKLFEQERPIHSHDDWIRAQKIYNKFNNSQNSNYDTNNGFSVPFQAKQVPGKGRGIFANTFTERGTLVWSNTYTARFSDGPTYKKFIYSLPDKEFACDVLQWAYVQDMSRNASTTNENDETKQQQQDLQISVDLDEGAYCNNGNIHTGEGNLGYLDSDCYEHFYALKDIQAGDEFVCPYESFHVYGGYSAFELE